MPIYEYRCTACNHELDVLQKMTDQPLQICPNCSQPTLQKQISAVAFRLKGSGWYETDFKGGSKKNIHGDGDKDGGDKDGGDKDGGDKGGGDKGSVDKGGGDKDKVESTPKTAVATTETKNTATTAKPPKT